MRLGIKEYEYSSKFYLTETEKLWAEDQFSINPKPIIAICTRSKEPVKNWPVDYWVNLIKELTHQYTIIQLGDEKEPKLKNVVRFAGNITMRESAALLSISKLFIGPDSLLMHIANGLTIKSVIIFGGSRPVECFGYNENTNLSSTPACSPCWIHDGYETCTHMMKCMNSISKENVLDAVSSILNIPSRKHLNN
jgi:ADP-heptose:LPS heptosyltransferase